MRKLAVILGIVMVSTTSALSAYAMANEMRGGSGMMGNFGSCLLDWFNKWRNGSEFTNPPGEHEKQTEQLDQQYQEVFAYLKYQTQMKEKGLALL